LINNGRKRLITEFNPSYDRFDINWDPVIKRWTEGSRTDRLLVDYYPYSDDKSGFPLELFFYHQILQDCHLQDPDFFYSIQAFGFKDFNYQSKWKWWRQPAPEEMNIALMLPLAHGAKGIIFWKYYTNMKWEGDSFSEDKIMEMDLVLWDNAAKKYVPTALWHKIKNDIAPRLKGTFGKILLKLKYTGMNSSSYSFEPGEKVAGFNYLSFSGNPDPGRKRFYDYHAGLFTDNTDPDDRYFMVVNTNPAVTGPYRLNLQSPDPRYKNFRLSNVEGGLDTTFTNKFSFILNYPPGEGFLYRLSPVVKYGGILIEDETINGIENLRGKLIISPGTALVIKGTYNLYDTIEVSEGGKLIMEDDARVNHFGGKIIYGATSKVYQELISKEKK